jgi:hypothetical protein
VHKGISRRSQKDDLESDILCVHIPLWRGQGEVFLCDLYGKKKESAPSRNFSQNIIVNKKKVLYLQSQYEKVFEEVAQLVAHNLAPKD